MQFKKSENIANPENSIHTCTWDNRVPACKTSVFNKRMPKSFGIQASVIIEYVQGSTDGAYLNT